MAHIRPRKGDKWEGVCAGECVVILLLPNRAIWIPRPLRRLRRALGDHSEAWQRRPYRWLLARKLRRRNAIEARGRRGRYVPAGGSSRPRTTPRTADPHARQKPLQQ